MSERPLDLGWMRIFCEVVRRGSLTSAAENLGLTQPAVSYQIRKIEDELQTALLRRKHRGIELTADGKRLFEIVSNNVDAVDLFTQQLRRKSERPSIRVHTDYAFSSLWLIPRMHAFRAVDPDINIQIVATQNPLRQGKEDGDVMVIFGSRAEAGEGAVLLVSEKIAPVCAPAYLQKAGTETDPRALSHHKLIHLENTSPTQWFDWRTYFSHFGVERQAAMEQGDLTFNNYSMVVQAAVGEQGLAIGWAGLVDPLVDAGVLVIAGPALDAPDRGYWLVKPKRQDGPVRTLTSWLVGQAR